MYVEKSKKTQDNTRSKNISRLLILQHNFLLFDLFWKYAEMKNGKAKHEMVKK